VRPRRAAARYANALFAVAKERGQTGLIARELTLLVTMYRASSDLREFFERPSLPGAAKRAAALEIGRRSGLSQLAIDFLALIAERRRADHLEAIAEKYEKLLDLDLRRVRAVLRSAAPLTGDERERLFAKLAKMLQVNQVVPNEVVDRTLLSGFLVENGTMVIDGSLKGQLDAVRRRLSE
jgi:F-type H+-transporting ATPase subunit delta